MKISIITPVYNGAKTIEDCIRSVYIQTYNNIEHIIIDGGSTDTTIDIIKKNESKIKYWISEADRGIYDAMNKGINVATGDIVGILNSDDFYMDEHVIADVVEAISKNNAISCYGDIVYVDRNNTDKTIRYWKSGNYNKENFKKGWMPPHPAFFVKRAAYERYGLLNLNFPLAADYEIMFRLLYKYGLSTIYIPRVLVKMRTGGTSMPGIYTLKSMTEIYKTWKINGFKPSPMIFIRKPLSKIYQYFYI